MDPHQPEQLLSQAPQHPVPPAASPYRPNFSTIFALVLLGIILVAGGYVLGQKNTLEKMATVVTPTVTQTPPTSIPSPSQEVSPTTTSTHDLMYTDTTLGVSFSYPSTWEVNHIPSLDGYWLQLTPKNMHYQDYAGPIEVSLSKGSESTPINLQNYLQGTANSTTSPYTLDDEKGYLMTNANCEPHICDQYIAVAHNNTAYLFMSYNPTQATPAPSDQKEVFNLLVKTFAFIK